jgi:hypothetical protein
MQTSVVAHPEERKVHRPTKPSVPKGLDSSRKEAGDAGEPEPKEPTPFWMWFIENPRSRESF